MSVAGVAPKMVFPLVNELAADRRIPIAVTSRVLGFSKQAYFVWRKDPMLQRDWDDAHLINPALATHGDEPGFGYRFSADGVETEPGISESERRVWRLCAQQKIWSHFSKKRGHQRATLLADYGQFLFAIGSRRTHQSSRIRATGGPVRDEYSIREPAVPQVVGTAPPAT